jgi:multidrug transporter EmrE-like cation transporter
VIALASAFGSSLGSGIAYGIGQGIGLAFVGLVVWLVYRRFALKVSL